MKNSNNLELSNYWDDFKKRVNETIDCINADNRPSLQRLTVHLTDGCNLRCEYCNMRFCSKTMDKKLAFKIVDDYVAMKGSTIHFTGGEPSIVPYINELFAYAKSKGLTVSSNTNGFKRINTENVDKLKTSFDLCDKEEFNRTMGRDCFDEIVENMKYYSKTMDEKMLSITAVLNRKTYKNMLSLVKFVQENFKVYNLYFSNYKGDNEDFAFLDSEIEDMFENYIPKVLEYFKETNNTYSYKQLSLYKPGDFRNVKERFSDNLTVPCYIQLSEMTIDVFGNCYNCSHLYRDGVKNIELNVSEKSLADCFKELKDDLKDNYVCLSEKCLNGCNTNLIGFNKAVLKGKKI